MTTVTTTRERIIQASSALFMERGYSASGLKQISAASDEPLRLVTKEIFESWLDAATVRLERSGVKRARARELATVFVAALEGGFLLSRAAKDTAAMDAIGKAIVELVESALREAGDDG